MMGVKETIKAIETAGLAVPKVLANARPGERMFREPDVNIGRFFAA